MPGRIRVTPPAPAFHLATVALVSPRVLVIDNYDSFVYNLVQYLGELGAEPLVRRHDAITVDEAADLQPDALLVSPGPGRPEQAGVSMAAIRWAAGRIPVLGVCLGHQCIGAAWGGNVVRAPKVMHGKTSQINHNGDGIFVGLPNPLEATRYHSLLVDRPSLPNDLVITATSDDDLIMGLRHRKLDVEGVQFHPESILTESGHDLLTNFLARID
ncbi:MAG TPA: anthranilate/aminodeoxychorismate synthase component II [Acidimicrobiaceae bacterium]|jgi:anthranilate synthase/aminodeoxychorismate synthase-like glutamine amidotransferase|nr:anthranilate/aminodeoxychorismate synthase component II [Acidimicrobiaceae bacterium]HCV36933.1 anthranilate/aminodeoxychorismate synthase component II [Acidimicrobiaceae bacterium]|tara:strand:- start:3703 stop:4344 length:642 start_codon:yes stop_codon:yes gene_type:complete